MNDTFIIEQLKKIIELARAKSYCENDGKEKYLEVWRQSLMDIHTINHSVDRKRKLD